MNSYIDWSSYWENLCVKHKEVNHLANATDSKKYFQLEIEELIFGSIKKLPGRSDGVFVVFSGFIDRITFNDAEKTKREMMLFFLQSTGADNFQVIPQAKTDTYKVAVDFASRLIHDSNEGTNPVAYTLTTGDEISFIPAEYKISGISYIGWQLVLNLNILEDFCYNETNWNP